MTAPVDRRLSSYMAVLLQQVAACVDPDCLTYESYRWGAPPVGRVQNVIVCYPGAIRLDPERSGPRFNAYVAELRFYMRRCHPPLMIPGLDGGEVQWPANADLDTFGGSWVDDVSALFSCLTTNAPGVLGTCQGPYLIESAGGIPDGPCLMIEYGVTFPFMPSKGCTGPGC